MDENKLEKILSEDHAPDIDINARKRAVNLAVAEFKTAQNEKNKESSQGISFLSRLIGINTRKGERTMEQKKKSKFIYGATVTAMAVVLVGALSISQMNETIDRHQTNAVGGGSSNNFGSIAQNTSTSSLSDLASGLSELFSSDGADVGQGASVMPSGPDVSATPRTDEEVAPAYVEAVEQESASKNDGVSDWRREKGASDDIVRQNKEIADQTVAVPAESVGGKLKKQVPAKDAPLDDWRRSSEADSAVAGATAPSVAEEMVQAPVTPQAKAERKAIGQSLYNSVPNSVVGDRMIAPYPQPAPPVYQEQNRDQFEKFVVNPFKQVTTDPVSTFSSDVDTASYSFVRKTLNSGRLPNANTVRVEEMVNYFDYNYPLPESRSEPFKPTVTVVDSPWAEGRKLMHIGIKGYQLAKTELRSNIVFLLDVSGSMNQPDKLPLVKNSMKMLLDSLHRDDTVSIVVYAGSTGVVLEPTPVSQRSTILNAMNNLRAGGGTAGAAGIRLAYDMAEQNFDKRAVNRVIMATDGDFNVGITNREELKSYIEKKRDKGIFLSVLGFGQGNYNDHMMQTLAQNGNGIAAYIDNISEARKVLVEEATSSLFPIAKDVKFQVEFNPNAVAEYRLIGYETRALKREDFNNDKIDAGDMGAGHTVTAIYEFVPLGSPAVTIDPLRYGDQAQEKRVVKPVSNEYAFLKIRYKLPTENTSKLITTPVTTDLQLREYSKLLEKSRTQNDAMFSIAVAAFGQILKGGEYTGNFSYDDVIAMAQNSKGEDIYGHRSEFIKLVRLAKTLSR